MKLFVDYSNQKLDKWLRMFELLIYQSEYVIENSIILLALWHDC